jgi:hypothetical protein
MSDNKENLTKQAIHSWFYAPATASRAGGGTKKTKMTRLNITFDKVKKLNKIMEQLPDDKYSKILCKYYEKLRDRKIGLAPPCVPK